MAKGLRRDALINDLQQLHAHYARLAESVHTTLSLLLEQHRAQAQPRMASILDEALALDQERRASTNGHGPADIHKAGAVMVKKQKRFTMAARRAQRSKSATFLAKFSTTEPRHVSAKGMGSLVRRGYLAKKGDGWVRTAKAYVV